MTMCTRSLLGDPPPPLGRLRAPHPSALQSLAHVAAVHRKYWASLRLKGKLFVLRVCNAKWNYRLVAYWAGGS